MKTGKINPNKQPMRETMIKIIPAFKLSVHLQEILVMYVRENNYNIKYFGFYLLWGRNEAKKKKPQYFTIFLFSLMCTVQPTEVDQVPEGPNKKCYELTLVLFHTPGAR
jgi:hypothetical protein